MRILFWVPYPSEGPSNRYRVEQYLSYLKKEGIKYSLHPFWAKSVYKILYKKGYFLRKSYFFILGTLFRFLDLLRLFNYDVVFIHREAYPVGGAFFEIISSLLKKPFIFDFDDAIFLPASSSQNNFIEKFRNTNKIVRIVKLSSYVIAGNSYLADFALNFNKYVTVIPTPIDTERYHRSPNREQKKDVVIGWIGSVTTSEYLYSMDGIFKALFRKFPNIKFRVVGNSFSIDGLSNIESKSWSLEDEIGDLNTFDIGIMPMPDNEWTRGKCGFKAILYMSMGIPCVCSPVGMNTEIISDGLNGFLATDDNEWVDKLSLLIQNPELRKRIGDAGRQAVEDRFSLKANAKKFIEVIEIVYRKIGK